MGSFQDQSPETIGQTVAAIPPAGAGQTCTVCGTGADPGMRFCRDCGHPLNGGPATDPPPEATAPAEPQPAAAPAVPAARDAQPDGAPAMAPPTPAAVERPTCACGQVPPEGAAFCHKCGTPVAGGEPGYRLVCVGMPDNGSSVSLSRDELIIGNVSGADLSVPEDEYLSRRHARVTRNDGRVWIEDLGSSNGTYLRVRQPVSLDVDDEILVGKTVLRVVQDKR